MMQSKALRVSIAIAVFLSAFAVHLGAMFVYCEVIIDGRGKVDLLFCTGEQSLLGAALYILGALALSIFVAFKSYHRRWVWLILPVIIVIVLLFLGITDLGIIPRLSILS